MRKGRTERLVQEAIRLSTEGCKVDVVLYTECDFAEHHDNLENHGVSVKLWSNIIWASEIDIIHWLNTVGDNYYLAENIHILIDPKIIEYVCSPLLAILHRFD
jgi:hypothetical protein